jgi:hypothetical protein
MSLLHQNTQGEIDDAARGEEFTQGTSHVAWASVVAAVLVTVVIALYMWIGQKPPAASGEIVQVWAHPRHMETSGFDANGAPMARDVFDEVLVFAHVKLHNQSKQPLFLHQILTNATLSDGGIHSSYAATAGDYDRIFIAYPELAALRGKPLPPETTLDPGQTQEGEIVSAFRLTKQQWDARKDLNFTFGFQYQPNLVLAPHSAVTEQ